MENEDGSGARKVKRRESMAASISQEMLRLARFSDVTLEEHGPFDFYGRADPGALRSLSIQLKIAIVAGLIVLALISTVTGYSVVEHRNPVTAFTQIFVPPPQQIFGKDNLLVLVEGLDYDYTAKDEEFSTNSRSDVIWAVNLDLANKRINELSIPRDMIATMPNGTQAKINQAQSDGGVKEAKSVIAQWLGIPGFDRYVILRIDASKEFIGAIGGVNLYVKTSDCLLATRRAAPAARSTTTIRGATCTSTSRRECSTSRRAGRRVHALSSRLVQRSVPDHAPAASDAAQWPIKFDGDRVNTLMHLGDLLSVFQQYVQTDFTNQELISLATHFQGVANGSIVSKQVPYTDDVNLPRYGDSLVPDTKAREQLVAQMLNPPPEPVASPTRWRSPRSRPRPCASTSRTAARSAVRRIASPRSSSTPDLRSVRSAMPIAPTTPRPRSTNTRVSSTPVRACGRRCRRACTRRSSFPMLRRRRARRRPSRQRPAAT